MTRIIEDSWVMSASGRMHQVFATNYDIFTQCGKRLSLETVRLSTTGPYPPVSTQLCKSCERSHRKVAA